MKKIWKRNKQRIGAIALALLLIGTTIVGFGSTAQAQIVTGTQYSWLNSYRGGDGNMAVIEDSTVAAGVPTSSDSAGVKWSTTVGSGWANATTGAIFVDGKLYVLGGGILKQIDTTSGALLKTATSLDTSTGELVSDASANKYNYFLTAGDVNGTKMIFVQTGLCVKAYNTDLVKVWESESAPSGNQGLCQLHYKDGVVYGATVNTVKNKTATYFALDASNGSYLWQTEAPILTTSYTGSYWAGGVTVGDYVIFGSEGARVTVFDKTNGDVVSTYDCFEQYNYNIRSAMSYDNGSLYFTTTNGYVWKIGIDTTTGQLQEAISNQITPNATASITTPTICNGRLYVGCTTSIGAKGAIGVLNAEDLSQIYAIDVTTGGGKVMDVAIVKDPSSDVVYGYSTYYTKPGSVICFTDRPGQTQAIYDDLGLATQGVSSQYSASQVMIGPDGTIYFTNDSGKLTAIEKNEAYLTSISANKGELKGTFSALSESYEIVAPVGTKKVVVSYGVSQGASVAVDGKIQSDNKVTCDLTQGACEMELVVSKGTMTRSYQLTVREVSTDVGLNVLTTTANSVTSSPKQWTVDGGNVYIISGINQPRVWYTATNANATLSSMDFSESKDGNSYSTATVTSSNVYQNQAYTKRIYYSRMTKTTSAYTTGKVTVTAEDGVTTRDYYILVTGTIPEITEAEDNIATEVKIQSAKTDEAVTELKIDTAQNQKELNLTDLLKVDVEYLNNEVESVENEIEWTSSNPSVAKVVQREVSVVGELSKALESSAQRSAMLQVERFAAVAQGETKTEYILQPVGNGTAVITASCGHANTCLEVVVSGMEEEDEEDDNTEGVNPTEPINPTESADTKKPSGSSTKTESSTTGNANGLKTFAEATLAETVNTKTTTEEPFETAMVTENSVQSDDTTEILGDNEMVENTTETTTNPFAVAVVVVCGCVVAGGIGYLTFTRKKKIR